MSRTVITNGLAFLTVLALLLFGGDVLKSFSWALFIGVVVSTYSTIYIASPVMLWWERFMAKPRAATARAPNATVTSGAVAASLEFVGAPHKRKRKKRK
jgi:preprotein translocase subunit SecF